MGEGEVVTLVTLFLVILGSEHPGQAWDGKAGGEGPIMTHCPGTEQHKLEEGQGESEVGIVASYLSWV